MTPHAGGFECILAYTTACFVPDDAAPALAAKAAKTLMTDHISQSERFARSVTLEQLARTENGAARSAMR